MAMASVLQKSGQKDVKVGMLFCRRCSVGRAKEMDDRNSRAAKQNSVRVMARETGLRVVVASVEAESGVR